MRKTSQSSWTASWLPGDQGLLEPLAAGMNIHAFINHVFRCNLHVLSRFHDDLLLFSHADPCAQLGTWASGLHDHYALTVGMI